MAEALAMATEARCRRARSRRYEHTAAVWPATGTGTRLHRRRVAGRRASHRVLRQAHCDRRTDRQGRAARCAKALRPARIAMNFRAGTCRSVLIGVALLLDVIVGDPAWLPHPVQLIGKAIEFGERHLRTGVPRQDIGRGTILVAGVVVIVAGCTWLVVGVAEVAGRSFAAAIAILVAWTTLALCGLDAAARSVQRALERDDPVAARHALPALVGRDPAKSR